MSCSGSTTYLQCEHADTASSLYQHGLSGQQRSKTIQSVPARERGARERAGLDVVQISGGSDEAILVEDSIFTEAAIDYSTKAGAGAFGVDGIVLVQLVEESDHLVSFLELGDLGARLDHLTGTVGVSGLFTTPRGVGSTESQKLPQGVSSVFRPSLWPWFAH